MCVLCNNAVETNEHLFSSCTYAVEVMNDQASIIPTIGPTT